MNSYSPTGKFKYLLTVIFLSSFVAPGYSILFKLTDTVKIQVKDTIKQQVSDSGLYKLRTFKAEDLIRGERLFYGLAYLKNESVNCAGCHNTSVTDTLNWNPDALEISKKYLHKSAHDLSRVLLKPLGQKMAQVHKDIHLTPEDIVLVKAYMDKFVDIGLKQNKPVITNLFLFIIASLLFLFSLIDITIIKILNRRWIDYIFMLSAGFFIINTLVVNAITLGRSRDYSPTQPVKFSHAVHAGQNGTECIYCHSSAPYSKTAGIPPLNVCMNCHLMVRNGTRSGVFEISKIIDSYENQKPIEWIKVHNLPDHVFFSHAQHVSAGGVGCAECHGDVKKMNVIKQVSDLSMGWCINCHRTKKLDFHNNRFYSQYRDLAEKLKKGEIDSVTVSMVGGRECMKCHY
ncbi:MAG: cytochrome c3 family protein [Bacteroidales bacterium]|jgi:cytochrome c553